MQGKTIYGYTLQKPLGVGGMAEVWLAENKIGKLASVKMLLPKLCADDNVKSRFYTEAKVTVNLNHPNIRQVYDFDEVDGRPAIIMEYLEGMDLKTMMKKGRQFTGKEIEKWWNQLVSALNYTHQKGIIHRDIKPGNIFIDLDGNVKLLDFGIAKVRESISATQTGQKLGTLMYMSPEQVRDSKHIDYHTDIYSLAVTFVHLITGKKPYDSETTSDFDIQLEIVTKPLDLSGLPVAWRNFLAPYLEKDPNKRPELQEFKATTSQVPTTQAPDTQEDIFETVVPAATYNGSKPKPVSTPKTDNDATVMDAPTKAPTKAPINASTNASLAQQRAKEREANAKVRAATSSQPQPTSTTPSTTVTPPTLTPEAINKRNLIWIVAATVLAMLSSIWIFRTGNIRIIVTGILLWFSVVPLMLVALLKKRKNPAEIISNWQLSTLATMIVLYVISQFIEGDGILNPYKHSFEIPDVIMSWDIRFSYLVMLIPAVIMTYQGMNKEMHSVWQGVAVPVAISLIVIVLYHVGDRRINYALINWTQRIMELLWIFGVLYVILAKNEPNKETDIRRQSFLWGMTWSLIVCILLLIVYFRFTALFFIPR